MKHLEDNIILLGLIVTTTPFEYKNNNVSSNFSAHIEKDDLENIKKELVSLLENPNILDEERNELTDEIYFINKIIESLEMM